LGSPGKRTEFGVVVRWRTQHGYSSKERDGCRFLPEPSLRGGVVSRNAVSRQALGHEWPILSGIVAIHLIQPSASATFGRQARSPAGPPAAYPRAGTARVRD